MPEQAPNIEPGRGRLKYDKERRTIVAEQPSHAAEIERLRKFEQAIIEISEQPYYTLPLSSGAIVSLLQRYNHIVGLADKAVAGSET